MKEKDRPVRKVHVSVRTSELTATRVLLSFLLLSPSLSPPLSLKETKIDLTEKACCESLDSEVSHFGSDPFETHIGRLIHTIDSLTVVTFLMSWSFAVV